MELSEIKAILGTANSVNFKLEDNTRVPEHFHITEVGIITKRFIDCGGNVRSEKVVNFQLWDANDYDHRLKPQKLTNIIALSEKILGLEDMEIEVEYQSGTIGKYSLIHDGKDFILISKKTACLASNSCSASAEKQKLSLSELTTVACCTPGTGCC